MSKIVEALREIEAMTFDPWTNGAKAGEIARAALAEHDAQPAAQPQQERTERERFEAWFANQLWHGGSAIENAFRTWQAALAQRKPLSDEQIIGAIMAVAEPNALGGHRENALREFARAIEAAHGIK